ncbi:hypothetical protein HONESTABE_99 [Bacillus phage HonestAbe]|nr:hypothetical protein AARONPHADGERS_104 [Bacillus phage AaronPhadgers]AUV57736.1 hypothetical protein HONESTABE_99 [Bacillus phage HonestAbe]
MTTKMYNVRPDAVKFTWEEFKPDLAAQDAINIMNRATTEYIRQQMQEKEDLMKKTIDEALEAAGFEYEAWTLSKPHKSLPSLITLYPSEKELIFFGVIEDQRYHDLSTEERFKYRIFDGYDEIEKGMQVIKPRVVRNISY